MVAWDGSVTAAQAFEKAAEMASRMEAEVHVVSVSEIPDYADTVGEYQGALEDAARFYNRKREVLEETASALASTTSGRSFTATRQTR